MEMRPGSEGIHTSSGGSKRAGIGECGTPGRLRREINGTGHEVSFTSRDPGDLLNGSRGGVMIRLRRVRRSRAQFEGSTGASRHPPRIAGRATGGPAAVPPHFALHFERGADLSQTPRKEVSEHRWEVAGADAYPWLVAVDEDLLARMPIAKEVRNFEAIALALPQALKASKALRDARNGDEPWVRTFRVRTHAGELDVTLRVRGAAGSDGSSRPPRCSTWSIDLTLHRSCPLGRKDFGMSRATLALLPLVVIGGACLREPPPPPGATLRTLWRRFVGR